MKPKTAVLLFSGGQDSSICLWWARTRFERVLTLSIDYGQIHDADPKSVEAMAIAWGARRHLHLDMPIYAHLSPNALVPSPLHGTSLSQYFGQNLPTFVPGRNLLFLSLAAAYAYSNGSTSVVLGVSQADYSGYPDCRASFVQSAQRAICEAFSKPFSLFTPLLYMKKSESWAMAEALRGREAVLELDRWTRTCYQPRLQQGPCHRCPSCRLRDDGWEQYLQNPSLSESWQTPLQKALELSEGGGAEEG